MHVNSVIYQLLHNLLPNDIVIILRLCMLYMYMLALHYEECPLHIRQSRWAFTAAMFIYNTLELLLFN